MGKGIIKKMKAVFIYWQLAIFRVSGKALIAIALSIAQGLNGAQWNQFTGTEKFVAIVLALGSGWAIIDAFLDTTMNEIRKHPDGIVIPGSETHTMQRTVTDMEATTKVPE